MDDSGNYVEALSAVLRLGRKGAATDHSSVMFDVDTKTGYGLVCCEVLSLRLYPLLSPDPDRDPWTVLTYAPLDLYQVRAEGSE